jgi:hypothetical protein
MPYNPKLNRNEPTTGLLETLNAIQPIPIKKPALIASITKLRLYE